MGKRRRSHRRISHRKVSRNRYVLTANRARGALRRLTRNVSIGGIDLIDKVVFPALGAVGGMIAAQWVGDKVIPRFLPGQDPRLVAAGASVASAFAAYAIGERVGLSPETQMSIAAGAGISGITPWLPLDLMHLAPPAPIIASSAPPANATSGYYQRGMLGGLMVDVSHAGAPYKGMFGVDVWDDPSDQGIVDGALSTMEAVSLVEPIDMAKRSIFEPRIKKVTETMATPRDHGWAGGLFVRDLFSQNIPS